MEAANLLSLNRRTLGSVLLTLAFVTMLFVPTTLADDPRLCRDQPDHPKCHQDPNEGPKKDTCEWRVDGAPANFVTFGAAPGSQVVTLNCPGHILEDGHWDCGYKNVQDGTLGGGILPGPACSFLGTKDDVLADSPCATTSHWIVNIPDVRVYTMFIAAYVWKDADCDGKPDDWNTSYSDGCALNNMYSPKHDSSWTPYKPQPDGSVDKCDMQFYEHQWRQYN